MHVARMLVGVALAAFAATALQHASAAQFPRVITGVVRDAAGEGIPGVLVEWGYFTAPPEERQTVTTGAGGKFRLVTAKVGRDFRLGFSKRGYSPVWYDRVVPGPAARPSEFNVTLAESPKLRVMFVTQAGLPVPGLKVSARTPSNGFHAAFSSPTPATPFPGEPQEYATDLLGQITPTVLPALPAGGRQSGPAGRERSPNWVMLHVAASDSGYYEHQITEEQALGEQPVVVKLPDYQLPRTEEKHRGVVRGRVVDAETGQPVTHFWTTLRHRPQPNEVQDADGRFTVGSKLEISGDNDKDGRKYEVRVFARGYAVAVAALPAVEPKDGVVETIKLDRHPSFEGRIVDAESGEPLAGVAVLGGAVGENSSAYVEYDSLDDYADGSHCLSNVLRITTDADGRFTLPEAPNHRACLILQHKGYELLAIKPDKRPEAGDGGVTTIPLHREAKLTAVAIRETPLGADAKYATLHYHIDDGIDRFPRRMRLSDEGRATFDGLPAGAYSLALDIPADDLGMSAFSKRVSVDAGQRRAMLLGALPGSLRLRGRTQPFAIVQLQPKFDSEITAIGVEVDVDGEFDINHLEPGEYNVEITISSASAGHHSQSVSREINLTEDQTF